MGDFITLPELTERERVLMVALHKIHNICLEPYESVIPMRQDIINIFLEANGKFVESQLAEVSN